MDQKWIEFAETRTGIPLPNCYTYARARISEIQGKETTISDASIGGAGNLWEIHNNNFTQSDKPNPGSLMIWQSTNGGYVAVCEKVNSDGTIEWSQSNYGGPKFEYISGVPTEIYIYIYIII